jgi:hypothetical protein
VRTAIFDVYSDIVDVYKNEDLKMGCLRPKHVIDKKKVKYCDKCDISLFVKKVDVWTVLLLSNVQQNDFIFYFQTKLVELSGPKKGNI